MRRDDCRRDPDRSNAVGEPLRNDDPVVVRALELLRGGACGDMLAVDFYRTSDYPPYAGGALPAAFRQGGYPFQDMGVHALYLMEAFLGPIRDIDVRYRSTDHDPNVFFDEWRGTVACAKRRRRFLSLVDGATDPQRALRSRDGRRHAHRLFSSDLHGAQIAAGPQADRRRHQRDDTGGTDHLARAEERLAIGQRIAAAFAGYSCRRPAVPRRAGPRSTSRR